MTDIISKFLSINNFERAWEKVAQNRSLEKMRQLFEKSKKLVKPSEDNVRFYWISEEAVSRVLTIGSEEPTAPPNYYVI
ncbi:CRISPR-associated endonuclease Cas2 [Nostoc sp.]